MAMKPVEGDNDLIKSRRLDNALSDSNPSVALAAVEPTAR